jgi:O-antigen/teichoic acid export membrane protein
VLKRNLVAGFVGQGWVALMGLVFVPFYIRYLGIEAYGVIGLYAVLQAALMLLDFGMTPTLSREIARFTGGEGNVVAIRDLLRSIEVAAVLVAVVIIIVVWLSSGWLSTSWLRSKELSATVVAQSIGIMGLVCALRLVEGIYRGCIIGLQRQILLNVVTGLIATLRGVGAVTILAWVSPTIQAFFVWQGIISGVTVVVLAANTYRLLPRSERSGRFSLGAWRRVQRFAGGMFSITVLDLMLTQIDKILLSRLLTLADYGYYTLAALAASALYTLIYPITQAWFPRLSQLHAANDTAAFARVYHQGSQLVSVGAGSAAVLLIVFSHVALSLWTRDTALAEHTSRILRLLLLGNLLNGLMNMPYQAQLAHRWIGLTLRTNCVATLSMVPAIFWATPRYGLQGAGWAWVCLNAGYVLITTHFMYRRILVTEKWIWYREDILYPLLAAAFVALCLRQILVVFPVGSMAYWATLLLGSLFTFVAAGVAAPMVRRQALNMLALYFPQLTIRWRRYAK